MRKPRWLTVIACALAGMSHFAPGQGPRVVPDPTIPPAVGERFLPPPPVPPTPPDLIDAERSSEAEKAAPACLSLADLEELARKNNPTLLQAHEQVQGALGKAIQAGLWPNPVVGYTAEQIGVMDTPGEFQGGFIRQEIVTARKRRISREKYLARTKVAEWIALGQLYRVLNDVRVHYFRALGRKAIAEIHQELLKNAEDNLLTTREEYNVGQATRAQVHEANATLQLRRINRLMAENDYRQELNTLAALVGVRRLPGTLGGGLEGDTLPIKYEEALDRLIEESPEMRAAVAKLRADQITVRRERVEPIPNVFVQGAVGYNFEAKETVAAAQVFLEVPIFDRNQGTIRQAQADLARQHGEIRRTELLLQRDLAREYRRYLTALQHVRNYKDVILPQSKEAYEVLLKSYKADRVAWPAVLLAERTYFRRREEYFMNLIAWREAEVMIKGYLLHDGLRAPTNPTPPGHIDAVAQPR